MESLLDKNSAGADYPSLFALYRKVPCGVRDLALQLLAFAKQCWRPSFVRLLYSDVSDAMRQTVSSLVVLGWPKRHTFNHTVTALVLLFFYAFQAMELEFAFFDAQLDEGTEDVILEQSVGAETGGRQGVSVQPGGQDAGGRGRFHGVHQRLALLCVDFDDTLTEGDTTSLLLETAKAQVRLG